MTEKLDPVLKLAYGAPIDMVLHCPKCHKQHIDAPETDVRYAERLHESPWWELGGDKPEQWLNRPHKSHLCHGCGYIWRPADVPTNGVIDTKTHGKNDSPKGPSHETRSTEHPPRAGSRAPRTAEVGRLLRGVERPQHTVPG